MKRLVSFILLNIILLPASSVQANDAAEKSTKQPIGIYSSDDGEKIVVGIGTTKPLATLDVSRGEVKIGSTGTPCRGVLAGTLRFAHTRLQLCDGTSWRNVSLDKAE